MLLQKTSMLGHMTTLTAFVTGLGRAMSLLSMYVLYMDIHVLLSGTSIVTIRAIKRFETFVH